MLDIIGSILQNDYNAAKKCLFNGANPNYVEDWACLTPLHYAAQENTIDIVKLLLHWKAAANVRERIFNETPLDYAEQAGHREVSALLRLSNNFI